MRVMQIDDFLELTQSSGSDAHSYDWARLIKEGRAARTAAAALGNRNASS